MSLLELFMLLVMNQSLMGVELNLLVESRMQVLVVLLVKRSFEGNFLQLLVLS